MANTQDHHPLLIMPSLVCLEADFDSFRGPQGEAFAFVHKKASEASKRRPAPSISANDRPRQMLLPGLEEITRAMPNHVARSSLFAPVARGRKVLHDQMVLATRADATITYTGYQLDEAQADVWMQLIYEAKDAPLGEAISFNRAAFLRAIGRGSSGREYEWLRKTMVQFTCATIVIEARKPDGTTKYRVGDTKAFHLLADLDYKADIGTYTFVVDPKWGTVFSGREYALIDWDKRLQIEQGQDMAKALQRLMSASSNPVQHYNLAWLKEMLQYTSPVRKFRHALKTAIAELRRVDLISSGRILKSAKGYEQVLLAR